jgi:hypothetical protein
MECHSKTHKPRDAAEGGAAASSEVVGNPGSWTSPSTQTPPVVGLSVDRLRPGEPGERLRLLSLEVITTRRAMRKVRR